MIFQVVFHEFSEFPNNFILYFIFYIYLDRILVSWKVCGKPGVET